MSEIRRGDIVFCRHTGLLPRLIRFFQRAQLYSWGYAITSIFRKVNDLAEYNHVAIISHIGVNDDWLVVQAEAHGVGWGSLKNLGDVQIVNSQLDTRGRELALALAQRAFGQKYGILTLVSIMVNTCTPRLFDLHRRGTFICSALVAQAMLAGGYPLPISTDLDQVSPAELAVIWLVKP